MSLTTRSTPRAIVAGLCIAAITLTGCGSNDDKADTTTTTATTEATTTAAAAAAELELTDVWARQSPMGTTAGAIYLSITSPVDDELVGASVPSTVAGKTEIHETVVAEEGAGSAPTMGGSSQMTTTTAMGGASEMTTTTAMGAGTMTMKPVKSIELAAGTKVELKPGGYHIMLLELVKPLKVGDSIELTLTFSTAGEKTVTAEVRES